MPPRGPRCCVASNPCTNRDPLAFAPRWGNAAHTGASATSATVRTEVRTETCFAKSAATVTRPSQWAGRRSRGVLTPGPVPLR